MVTLRLGAGKLRRRPKTPAEPLRFDARAVGGVPVKSMREAVLRGMAEISGSERMR